MGGEQSPNGATECPRGEIRVGFGEFGVGFVGASFFSVRIGLEVEAKGVREVEASRRWCGSVGDGSMVARSGRGALCNLDFAVGVGAGISIWRGRTWECEGVEVGTTEEARLGVGENCIEGELISIRRADPRKRENSQA